MAQLLKGAPVLEALEERMISDVDALKEKGIFPTLAIVRVGENESDKAYEKGAMKRCEKVGVIVKNVIFKEDIDNQTFQEALSSLNNDDSVHGILMLRPLPKHLDEEYARKNLNPLKDVDGSTDGSLAGVFTDSKIGFPPCTAQAVMEILSFYGIELDGKNATILGRSLVIGRPVAMMLMKKGVTPTICHSHTKNAASKAKDADILISCIGKLESIGAEYTNPDQVIIDVGINWSDEKQKICGDLDFEEVEPLVKAATPVPGGVGSVTTGILVSHVVEAAKKAAISN